MTISLSLRRGDLIRLPVRLRHRKGCRRDMLLDTGARFTVIDADVADELGLEVREAAGIRMTGVVGSAPVSRAEVDTVSVLGQSVRNLEVLCYPLQGRLGIQGILGMNFLRHFNFTVDNDSETITFELRRE